MLFNAVKMAKSIFCYALGAQYSSVFVVCFTVFEQKMCSLFSLKDGNNLLKMLKCVHGEY